MRTTQNHTRAPEAAEERVSGVYSWYMQHARRMPLREIMPAEIQGGCEGYGDMPSVAEGSCGAARSGRTG
jgi:hypothetical protein